jgi:DNA polymerase elongation subunit (family B)
MRELSSGEVPVSRLAVSRRLTREDEAYRVATRTRLAARQLREAGVRVHPGERVRYVITDARGKGAGERVRESEVDPARCYDAEDYIRLLKLAAGEVMSNHQGHSSVTPESSQLWLPFQ